LLYMNYQDRLSFSSPEKRIDRMEDRLTHLQNQAESGEEAPNGLNRKTQIEQLKEQINHMKQRMERNETLATGKWKPIVRQEIEEAKKTLKKAQNEEDDRGTASLKGHLMELQYQLSHNIRPQTDWEESAYDQMT